MAEKSPDRDEMDVLQQQIDLPSAKVEIWTLYRYATILDYAVLLGGTTCAIAGGAALPLMSVIFGKLAGIFQDTYGGGLTPDDLTRQTRQVVLYFVYLSITEFVTVTLSTLSFIKVGERLSCQIREHFLESCLRQNIGFYDASSVGEITTRITSDTNLVQEGISEKLALALSAIATFASVFIIGSIMYWKLTLIMCSTAVAILATMNIGSRWMIKYSMKSFDLYALGGTVADEAFSSIRNVKAFGTQERLAAQYDAHLKKAEHYGFRMQVAVGIMYGLTFLIMYLGYGLAF